MTRQSIYAAATLIIVGTASALSYNNATIKFDPNLDCTSCIRGGYDYCLYSNASQTVTATSWQCNLNPTIPEANVTQSSTGEGYVCSGALKDQTNAIINGCRPIDPKNRLGGSCGEYFVDLRYSANIARNVDKLPVNASCTWRAVSNCGFPAANIRVINQTYLNDFDVAFTAYDGLLPDEELNGWEFNWTSNWFGTFQTNSNSAPAGLLSQGYDNDEISEANWLGCNGTVRNLYVTVTRTKDSSQMANLESPEFLSRQLQIKPNGTVFNDIEVGFTFIRGGKPDFASYIKVATFALVAVLSVFAF